MTSPKAPPATFAHLLVSLGQSAFVALGETKDPSGASRKDPAQAAYNLAILQVLQAKTAGNLDDDESKLLATLIQEIGEKLPSAG